MTPITIEADQLTKVYKTYLKRSGFTGAVRDLVVRTHTETVAANQVSFKIREGELVGFLGPNGAGKTTTLKMLSGLLYPSSGKAQVLGYVPWQRKPEFKRQFALVMGQKNQLWWDLPAAESLALNRVIYGLDKTESQRTIDELTEWLDVRQKLHVMVRELSLGERMKMELIAALLHRPKILFLDEPTIGLDVVSQKKVREFLKDYTAQRKITTLLTSHYMQDIEMLCERVIIIDHGCIQFDGALRDILDRFSTDKIVTLTFETLPIELKWENYGEILEQNELTVKLKVKRQHLTRLNREILGQYSIQDVNIQEVPIEDIIRELFSQPSTPCATSP
ncbi:MAG: ATP-binding cassette domain-containing protein [Verrucomicrobiae bacterium]|nr:ATP-binding cassette domain-containing protein [Verrucomicrobiae bacterium]